MKSEVIEKLTSLVTAAFGLVAALAWNDTVKALFATLYPENNTLGAMFGYAVLVTVIAVVITIELGKLAERIK